MTTGIAVFLKYPEPGKVKTRLAVSLGNVQAAAAYARMQRHVLQNVVSALPAGFAVTLYGDPFVEREIYLSYFATYSFPVVLQRGDGLGARLMTALEELLEKNEVAMAIGTDCVAMTPSHIEDAARRIRSGADLVLGPAEDGGYYLIALRKPHSALFSEIAWSTSTVLSETVSQANRLGLKTEYLETLPDIDTKEDWERSALSME